MSKKIIIDASNSEETKFCLINQDNELEEFDYQNTKKKAIKGNIYLAKVNRIEPALDAAFLDYGAERKGFISFEMIHPKYYQIPTADQDALLEKFKSSENSDNENEVQNAKLNDIKNSYKIQEVIKKDQVMLVQVEKEERGNKGAFLSTYIYLSGRYCVFAPNSIQSTCFISKKLDDSEEKVRLKSVADELLSESNNGSLILRTAASYRTKKEIVRDFNYLARSWDSIKKRTVSGYAPSLIYEEGDLLINGIKSFYTSDVSKIIVSGKEAYKKVYEFAKVFIPKNLSKLEEYKKSVTVTNEYKIDKIIRQFYSNKVSLKSGGYIIINITEALVAIDVNSGKYTGEYNIESTAVTINTEAAEEIAKQLRFRGLSGLIVIDFIDMTEQNNKDIVENKLKRAFYNDRAKIQLGKITEFGLLEMSRQRMGRSFSESNMVVCNKCDGVGRINSKSSIAFSIIDNIKDTISNKSPKIVNVFAVTDVIMFIFNKCRNHVVELENDFNVKVNFYINDSFLHEYYKITLDGKGNLYNKKYEEYKEVMPLKTKIISKPNKIAKNKAIKKSKPLTKSSNSILDKFWKKLRS